MPTVLKIRGLRVVIYPNDHRPAHVHVIGGGHEAVFDLNCPLGPPTLIENYGFQRAVIASIRQALGDDVEMLCRRWEEIHGQTG